MIIGDITNGIVLDHIEAGRGMKVYQALHLEELSSMVVLINNAESRHMGRKDVIKISQFVDIDLDLLGYLAPGVTVSVIRDGEIAVSEDLELPEKLVNIVECKNPRCITSVEQELAHEFRLTNREKRIYRCIYCESEA